MFTGLIKGLGRMVEKKLTARSGTLKIKTDLSQELQLGDSVAVNGVCLTVARRGDSWVSADVMPATLQATNLGLLHYGDPVNLEPALMLGERLGGHLVSGHVDGIGRIRTIRADSNAVLIQIVVAYELGRSIFVKGSVAVDGVSLTVQRLFPGGFEISLIPHTLRETAFCQNKAGDIVNLETDHSSLILGRTMPNESQSGITEQFLAEHGFA